MHEILLVKTSKGFQKYPDKNPFSLEVHNYKHRKYRDFTQREAKRIGVGSESIKRDMCRIACRIYSIIQICIKNNGIRWSSHIAGTTSTIHYLYFQSQQQT